MKVTYQMQNGIRYTISLPENTRLMLVDERHGLVLNELFASGDLLWAAAAAGYVHLMAALPPTQGANQESTLALLDRTDRNIAQFQSLMGTWPAQAVEEIQKRAHAECVSLKVASRGGASPERLAPRRQLLEFVNLALWRAGEAIGVGHDMTISEELQTLDTVVPGWTLPPNWNPCKDAATCSHPECEYPVPQWRLGLGFIPDGQPWLIRV